MIAGQADLTVSKITGAPLTPTVFRTFRGIHVVTSNEFLEPLKANAMLAGGGALLFAAMVGWMARLVGRDDPSRPPPPWTTTAAFASVGVVSLLASTSIPWPGPPPPIEVAFAREWLRLDPTVLRGSEHDAIRELRAAIGLPATAAWISDEYPLVYGWTDSPPPAPSIDRPDIVVVMIESLRADQLGFGDG